MKKNDINKWGLILAFGFFWISITSFSQEIKMSRQEKKEARKAEQEANYEALNRILNTRNFVLEADYLENRFGDRISVTSTINFISVDSTKGVLQTGSNTRTDYNGVGGVTAEGTLSSWKVERDYKNLSYSVRFSLLTNLGIYDISMTVGSDFRASAVITGLTSGKIIYKGRLKSGFDSKVFKGHSTI
jgi:hypothetical protein